MSALTIATLALIVVVVIGLVIVLADEYAARFGRTEIYHISTRELPNVAADLHATDLHATDLHGRTGVSDRDSTRR